MSTGYQRSQEVISWRDRMTAVDHELHVACVVLAGAADNRTVPEGDWQRLATCLHRLRALAGVR